MNRRSGRTAPEWVTFAVSCVVLLVVAATLAIRIVEPREPAAPVATVAGPARMIGEAFFVDVVVRNEGDETAANVQVGAELRVDGSTTEADQVIDFLAGDEAHQLVFVFSDDPGTGDLEVRVGGFSEP